MHQANGFTGVSPSTNYDSPSPHKTTSPVTVAIVGGGIVGLVTALSLLHRGIDIKLYEQARCFREIGAGVAFTTNAQKCMNMCNPDILRAMKSVSTKNPSEYYTYVDGYHGISDDEKDTRERELFRIHAGDTGFDGCHRARFLDELVKYLPAGVVEFQKRLVGYTADEVTGEVNLEFENGTSAIADAVIGCDGIKSRVRQLLFGLSAPESHPTFTHKVAFRGLVRMDKAIAALGEDRPHNQCMHMGPKGHVLNFPIAQHTLMNVVAFITQDGPWTHEKMIAPATREEAESAFKDWNPAVRGIMSLLDEKMDKWAIFDTFEHPVSTYAVGNVCLAGDAAHACSPHHGAGAGFGVEDALALAVVFEEATQTLSKDANRKEAPSKVQVLSAALKAYDAARRERSQWLVQSARAVCETYEWADPDYGDDPDKCKADIEGRAHKIWHFDIEGMMEKARKEYARKLSV